MGLFVLDLQPCDGLVERLINDICSNRATGFSQIAKAFSALLDKLGVVNIKLAKQDRNQLVDVVDDLSLARDAQNPVQREENSELLFLL